MKMKKYKLSIPIVGYVVFTMHDFCEEDVIQNFDVCEEWDLESGDPDLDTNNWIVEEIKDEDNLNG